MNVIVSIILVMMITIAVITSVYYYYHRQIVVGGFVSPQKVRGYVNLYTANGVEVKEYDINYRAFCPNGGPIYADYARIVITADGKALTVKLSPKPYYPGLYEGATTINGARYNIVLRDSDGYMICRAGYSFEDHGLTLRINGQGADSLSVEEIAFKVHSPTKSGWLIIYVSSATIPAG